MTSAVTVVPLVALLVVALPLHLQAKMSSIDPITLSPQRDYLISKSSNNNVTYNCTFLSTTGHDSSSILWKIGNATLLDRDQYVQFGVNALDSSNRIFSQLFFSPAGRAWLFSEIEEMNISVQCLGSERGFVVTETGSISSIVVCGTIPKVRDLRVDVLDDRSVVSWNRPSIYQPLDLTYSIAVLMEGRKLYEWNTTDREVMLPEDFNCDKCQVAVKSLNSSCDDSETAVWDMGPIPICVTVKPFMRNMIGYICDDDNQKIFVTFPEATSTGDYIINRTVTVTASGVQKTNKTVFRNQRSIEITGLVRQARYDVTVTVCTGTCCHETKPVTLSTSCVLRCSITCYGIIAGIKCEFSDAKDTSSDGTGVQLVITTNGERMTINITRKIAAIGYSFSLIHDTGSDIMAYDWNPVTSARGSLLVPLSVARVTSINEFNFSIENKPIAVATPSKSEDEDDEPCNSLAVGLVVGFVTLSVGALLGITLTLVFLKMYFEAWKEALAKK